MNRITAGSPGLPRAVPLAPVDTPGFQRARNVARNAGSTILSTARQVSRTRLLLTAVGAVALVAIVLLAPFPNAMQLRDWATAAGPWLPPAFFAAHALVTVLPFPRTAFTLAAGLLFGPGIGIGLAVTASACSALLALLAVRAAGWQLNRLVDHPGIDALDSRLRERGWPAVLSLRLIPAVPFSVLNYAAGASSVRTAPYLLATLAGLVPGTSAVVILGDAITGDVSPVLLLVSLCTGGIGVCGLLYEARAARRRG